MGQAARFVVDYQLVRGINYLNIRGLNAVPAAGGEPRDTVGWYVSRAQHLLAIGRPAAQVALFHPTDSMWLGDQESDTVTIELTAQLMDQQIDFDYIDITAKVVAALPKPDEQLDAACAPIKYMHRSLKDGEVYFFFNESDQAAAHASDRRRSPRALIRS